MKAGARIAAIFSRSGIARDQGRSALATRGASLAADGSGAPSHRRTRGAIAAGALALLALSLGAAPALATPYHPYLSQLTGSDTPATGFGGFLCGTTVDANGALYVSDNGNNVVDVFDTSGAYLTQIADPALNGPCGLAVDASGNVYIRNLNLGNVVEFNPSAFPVTGSTTYSLDAHLGESSLGANDGNGVLDASGSATDVALNPSNDHPFVAEGTQVQEYDATGAAVGSPFGSGDIAQSSGLAVRANGDVYLADIGQARVEIFSGGTLSSSFNASDSPSGGFAGPSGVAFDPTTSHVYVVDAFNGVVDEFDASGAYVARITAFQTPQGFFSLTDPADVAIDRSGGANDGHIYLTDDFNNVLDAFGPTADSTPPTDSLDDPSAITSSGAHLSGLVNPEGLDTHFHFEYSTDEANWTPLASQDAGSGSSDVPVADDLTGLEPNKTYFVRLVADNGLDPQAVTADKSLTTDAVAPEVAIGTLQRLSDTGARLHGYVNPHNSSVSDCHFEYSADNSFSNSVPCSPAAASLSGNDPVEVTADANGLAAGTAYHYRLKATDPTGTTTATGPDFSTLADSTPPNCANAALRTGPSAGLPDCRAYEQVSPTAKNGGDVLALTDRTRAADDGGAVQYSSFTAFGDAAGTGATVDYIAARNAGGWATHAISPLQQPIDPGTGASNQEPAYVGEFSPDLNLGVYSSYSPLTNDPNTAATNPLYLRTDLRTAGAGTYQELSSCPGCASPIPPRPVNDNVRFPSIDGASADFSHVIFESKYQLTADSTADPVNDHMNLYEWANGSLRNAGLVPSSGTSCTGGACVAPANGSIGGQGSNPFSQTTTRNTISSDGSRIFFTVPASNQSAVGAFGNVYMRVNGTSTVQLNASERTVPQSPADDAYYQGASADGSRVFFTSSEALTDDASANGQTNLYMYDIGAPAGHHLTLISNAVDDNTNGGGVIGTSADGHYVYFTGGRFAPQQVPGNPTHDQEHFPVYLWHDGAVAYIGLLDNANQSQQLNYASTKLSTGGSLARVTPDGRHLIFFSRSGTGLLTPAYDHGSGCVSSGPCQEVYLYSADSGELACLSCRPSGAPASADASNRNRLGASFAKLTTHLNHAISADGRYVFFHTAEKLLPEDTNGRLDVYEFDAQTGQLHLISSGSCACDSYFMDASADGSDVFFTTRDQLVGQDRDQEVDLYDARVGGGLASQNQPPPPSCSDSSTCQGNGSGTPADPGSGSSGFSGPGNQGKNHGGSSASPAKKKCKKKLHKRRCKRSRAANTSGGGSK